MNSILVADDEPNARLLVKRVLEKKFKVIEAEDGDEAVKLTHKMKPDLVLLDIMMPKVDGFEACYQIKQNKETAGTPVIMLTAVDYELNRKLGERVGADSYITKPINPQQLMDKINELLK